MLCFQILRLTQLGGLEEALQLSFEIWTLWAAVVEMQECAIRQYIGLARNSIDSVA